MAAGVSAGPLLSVRDLQVRFGTERGTVHAVNGVSFDLFEGRTLAIVGESGSGKSVTAKTLMNLLPRSASVSGQVTYEGRDVRALAAERVKHFFGVEMTMVFQDPMTSLNPVKRVGEQIAETLRYHLGRSRGDRRAGGCGAAGAGRHARTGAAGVAVSPRTVGRFAPAGGDRDGSGLPAPAAYR